MANFISGGAKYPVAELNKVASRKTGEIEAQCKLNEELDVLYNGEIVYVDAVNNEITKTFSADTCVDAIYLHFSNPRRYEDGHSGMENFKYERNDDYETFGDRYLPRVYKLTVGDIFTTNYDFTKADGSILTAKVAAGTAFTFGDHKIVVIDEPSALGTMPNGAIGATYRVIA